jgi:hypothetical protein
MASGMTMKGPPQGTKAWGLENRKCRTRCLQVPVIVRWVISPLEGSRGSHGPHRTRPPVVLPY